MSESVSQVFRHRTSGGSCIVIARNETEVRFIAFPGKDAVPVFTIQQTPAQEFDADWESKGKVADVAAAANYYLNRIEEAHIGEECPDVVTALKTLLAAGGSPVAAGAEQPGHAEVETPPTSSPAPSAPLPSEVKPVASAVKSDKTDVGKIPSVTVSVGGRRLVIGMPESEPQKMQPSDFADRPISNPPGDAWFYVALNEAGIMEGCIANRGEDRQVVAATIGNWAAEGYVVDRVNRKGLGRLLRKAESVVKGGGETDSDDE